MRRITPLITVLLVAAVAASAAVAHTGSHPYTHNGPHRPGLPDLAADAPDGLALETYDFGGTTGSRLLLRFNGYIHNKGTAGTLELLGANRQGSQMADVRQRQYTGDGTTWIDHARPAARLLYETGDGHQHWHLREAARYSLRAEGATADALASAKVGFCMIDSQNDYELGMGPYVATEWHWQTSATSAGHQNCGEYRPEAGAVTMGLTPGWRDTYGANLWFQWIDVSSAQPGPYRVRSEVDPSGWVIEADEVNPVAQTPVTLPGYVARATSATGLSPIATSTVQLSAQSFTGPLDAQLDPPRFRIDQAPADGTLNVPTGQWFSGSSVQYTPNPGADGNDSFRYSVRESGRSFPLAPASATATLQLSGPAPPAEQVAISGAPSTVETGGSAQLSAAVSNPRGEGRVTWSIDGANAGAGSVSADGLYRAPATVPSPDTVTVRATSDRGASTTVTFRVVAPPVRQPAPTNPIPVPSDPAPAPAPAPAPTPTPTPTPAPVAPAPGRKPTKPSKNPALRGLSVTHKGSYVVVTFVPGKSGRVSTQLTAGNRRIARCLSRIDLGRRYTCRLLVRSGARGRLSVRVAIQRGDGRRVFTRRAAVPARR